MWDRFTVAGCSRALSRQSGYLVISLLARGDALSACQAMIELLESIAHKVKTATTDNGGEFAWHATFDAAVGCKTYFCRPCASCERTSNENANGSIRQYLPKSRDLSTMTDDEIVLITDQLNTRPHKRLGFKTPKQMFFQSLHRVAIRH